MNNAELAALLREAACRADMEMDGDDAAYVVSRINRVIAELERAEPVAVDADERSLPDLGNELHNLSCTINHTREDWAEQIEGIAIELWNWKERTPPAPQVPECQCCGYPGHDLPKYRKILQDAAVPDGYALVPARLTAENGAKAALSGEFHEFVEIDCPLCEAGEYLDGGDCEECEGSETTTQRVPVSWATIKKIHAGMVEHFAAAPQPGEVE